jgi:hypothetical protein
MDRVRWEAFSGLVGAGMSGESRIDLELRMAFSDAPFNDILDAISAVPEPSTLCLLGTGLASLFAFRRRARRVRGRACRSL